MPVDIDPSVGHDRALLLFQEELAAVRTAADLQTLRSRWVGRKASWVAAFMELVGRATPEEKRTIGRQANELKKTVEAALADRESAVNLNMGTLVGSYASIARMLDEVATVPNTGGVLLTFDDFILGTEAFGERIQPLMKCRQAPGGLAVAAPSGETSVSG